MNSGSRSRRLIALAASAVALALAAGAAGQAPPPSSPALTLLSRDGRRTLPLSISGDQELVALDDLASIFQLAVHEESPGAITVSARGRTIVLTSDQALASVAGRLVSLPAPPTRVGRRWLVPVEFVSRALAPILDVKLDLRKPSRLLIVGDLRVPRVTVREEAAGAGARLTIDALPRASATVSQQNAQVAVHFDTDALDLAPLPSGLGAATNGVVENVRVLDATTLGVDLGPRFGALRAATSTADTSSRVTLDLLARADATPTPSAATPPAPPGTAPAAPPGSPGAPSAGTASPTAPSNAPPPELPGTAPASSIRTIVIDPGHGGDDEGAHGPNGTKEKDVTLAVARRLKTMLETRLGVRVLLTRDDDRPVEVDSRAAVANNNKADLFVSVHANASLRPSAAGASVWLAAFDGDALRDAQQAAGTAERLPTFGGGTREIEIVHWDVAQARHLDESTDFAQIVTAQLQGKVPVAAHPIERAPLRVLESANMPAVVVEMGYLTNPEQEPKIASADFQASVAQALADSVARYRDALDAARQTDAVGEQPVGAVKPRSR